MIAPELKLHLQKDACVRLTDAAGTTLGACSGTLWITQTGDAADYVLEPGCAMVLERNGVSLVCSMTEAVLRLDPPLQFDMRIGVKTACARHRLHRIMQGGETR